MHLVLKSHSDTGYTCHMAANTLVKLSLRAGSPLKFSRLYIGRLLRLCA